MLSNQNSSRNIVHRTRGRTQGAITRLMSPSDLGQLIKPFVFLDHAAFDGRYAPIPMGFGWHPHSGIATVTVMVEGAVRFAETGGQEGVLPAGAVEWMRASGGVWHTGQPEAGRTRAVQLWVALPPELENAPYASRYVISKDVPVEGPVRVILGAYGGARSPIDAPPMTYLHVNLKAGERWTYRPPKSHTVAWVAVHDGLLLAPSPIPSGEIAIFEPSEQSIDFVAEGPTGFVLGSAARHPHELALGAGVHRVVAEALRRGETEIRRIGQQFRAKGTIQGPSASDPARGL
jgi:redox-sensitive bicupin YhaK (pirin superfamily)